MRWILYLTVWMMLLMWLFRKSFIIRPEIFRKLGAIGAGLSRKSIDAHLSKRQSERIRAIRGESVGLMMRSWLSLDEEVRRSPSWRIGTFAFATTAAATVGFFMTVGSMGVVVGILSAIGCSMLPYFIMRLGISSAEAERQEKLLVAMANIQSEYSKSGLPFVIAVNQALPTIAEPLYTHFKTFVDTLLILNPDHPMTAYKVLERRIDHYFFTEYLSLIRLVEDGDLGLKATLEAVPEAFQAFLDHNRGYRQSVDRLNENFIMTLLTLPMILGFIQRISPEYHSLLVGTTVGRMALVVVFSGFITAAGLFIRYNNPVVFEI